VDEVADKISDERDAHRRFSSMIIVLGRHMTGGAIVPALHAGRPGDRPAAPCDGFWLFPSARYCANLMDVIIAGDMI